MKTIVINAGPKRKDVNTQLAQSALKGAESVGAEVVVKTFSNISKNVSSNSSEEELKVRENQMDCDLKSVFEIGANLSK